MYVMSIRCGGAGRHVHIRSSFVLVGYLYHHCITMVHSMIIYATIEQ